MASELETSTLIAESRTGDPDPPADALLLCLFRLMVLIRRFEEAVLVARETGEITGVVHPYAGHEAVAVGVIEQLGPLDWVGSHYRCHGHGHAIVRGCDVRGVMAELFGREAASATAAAARCTSSTSPGASWAAPGSSRRRFRTR